MPPFPGPVTDGVGAVLLEASSTSSTLVLSITASVLSYCTVPDLSLVK